MNIKETLLAANHDSGRAGKSINSIVVHTTVGGLDGSLARFRNPAVQVSSNYMIDLDGTIYRLVRESDTAWCNGNYQSNLTSISIEHVDNGDYNGPRTPQLYQASSELIADICRRYSIPCDRAHIKGHNEVIDKSRYPGGTACPDSLDIAKIIEGANAILNPATPAPVPVTPSATGETVTLPADNDTWRIYPLDKLPRVGNEKGMLLPKQYGGLTYAVLGHPYPNVVTIQTQMLGIGNIWVGPDTDAQVSAAPTPPAVSPAIQPAKEDNQPTNAKSSYTRLEKPLTLEMNKEPTNVYNLDAGSWATLSKAVVRSFPKGTQITVVGRADHPLGGKYYMAADSFGDADKTGVPTANNGINTVDLSMPAAVEASQPEIKVVDNSGAPEPVVTPVTDDHIPVKVTPSNPDGWKTTFKTNLAGEYTAQASTTIHDLANPEREPLQLVKGQAVKVLGSFVGPDKIEYYKPRLKSYGVTQDHFFGIPQICLDEGDLEADSELLNLDLAEEAANEFNKGRKKVIKATATLDGKWQKFINSLLAIFRKNKK